jgi:hypothetical protein
VGRPSRHLRGDGGGFTSAFASEVAEFPEAAEKFGFSNFPRPAFYFPASVLFPGQRSISPLPAF